MKPNKCLEWVHVDDKRPNDLRPVLTCNQHGFIDTDFLDNGRWLRHGIEYWMDLPNAPEGLSKEL